MRYAASDEVRNVKTPRTCVLGCQRTAVRHYYTEHLATVILLPTLRLVN